MYSESTILKHAHWGGRGGLGYIYFWIGWTVRDEYMKFVPALATASRDFQIPKQQYLGVTTFMEE